MNGYRYTRVWEIDRHLIVADTIEDAIALYKQYMGKDYHDEPKSISAVHVSSCLISQCEYYAIIKEESHNTP